MRKKNDPSRDQLARSHDRRIKHLMIRVLQKFEDMFPDVDDTREGQIFKGDVRNAFNDVIRAQRDEIHDYDVDYRPLKMTEDNTLAMTQTFMQSVKMVHFGWSKEPFFCIIASEGNRRVMEALRHELGAGVLFDGVDERTGEATLHLEIVGVEDCVNSVLLVMDKYRMHSDVRESYIDWRRKVVNAYRGLGNGKNI